MRTVESILSTKGRNVWSISPDATVYEALELMAEKGIGTLLVLEEGQVAGIFSERDHVRKVDLKGRTARDTRVGEVMTTRVAYVNPQQTLEECMALMTEKRFRHLPVLNGDELAGVVSIGDIVKAIISEQDFVIQQLENYIRGGDYY
jgi:CBS domain-containing protein